MYRRKFWRKKMLTLPLKKEILKNPLENNYEDFKKRLIKSTNLKGKKLFMPLRYIFTGSSNGPNLSDVYPLIKNYLGEIVK